MVHILHIIADDLLSTHSHQSPAFQLQPDDNKELWAPHIHTYIHNSLCAGHVVNTPFPW